MKGGEKMINEYVIEGKCLFEPFTDVDGHKRLYVQLNINSNRGLVYTRSYNPKLINSIMKEVHTDDSLIITGYIQSIIEAGQPVLVLNTTEYSVKYSADFDGSPRKRQCYNTSIEMDD